MYSNILLLNDDVALDEQFNPVFFTGKQVLEQSLRNRIFEFNFMVEIIGERSQLNRRSVYQKIKLEVEKDSRIVPGSCRVNEVAEKDITLTATSIDGEALALYYSLVNDEPAPEVPSNNYDSELSLFGLRIESLAVYQSELILSGVFVQNV